MSRLLHIECSPRKTRSASIEIARAFLAEYREHHPQDTIEVLDLWSTPLPEFDGDALEGKYAGLAGLARSPAQDLAWTRIRELAAMLHAADKLVISMPMWNFGVPYKFKHFVDLISHKDVLFSFTPACRASWAAARRSRSTLAASITARHRGPRPPSGICRSPTSISG
jgi:FMN-dependent NADH-azoreductase